MEQKIIFGFLGNGITVWTSCENKTKPDCEAHISPNREITYYQENTPKYFTDAVEKMANEGNMTHGGFLILRPLNAPTKYCDTKFYGRFLICEETFDGEKHFVLAKSKQIVDGWRGIKDIDKEDNRPVYLVGNIHQNKFGRLSGNKFGFSFSRETAEEAANAIRNWKSDFYRNAVVVETTQDMLLNVSLSTLVNLDWED